MRTTWLGVLILAGGLAGGCKTYEDARPPVDQLDKRDKGLQSKDVVQASDQMAMDLLADPGLNASHDRWIVVVDRVENRTVNSRFDLDVFLERLKVNLSRHGKGRVQLIENRDKLHELQSRELDRERDDAAAPPAAVPQRTQPDYGLYARINELPNRGTSYYLIEFTLTDLRTGQLAWNNAYEVRVER
jgi:hypothetical protein